MCQSLCLSYNFIKANLEEYPPEPCLTSKMKVFAKIVRAFSFDYFRKKLHLACFARFSIHLRSRQQLEEKGPSQICAGFWIRLCSHWLFAIRFILDVWQNSEGVSAVYTTITIKCWPIRSVGYLLTKFRIK